MRVLGAFLRNVGGAQLTAILSATFFTPAVALGGDTGYLSRTMRVHTKHFNRLHVMRLVSLAVSFFAVLQPSPSQAYVTLHGGPTYDGSSGYSSPTFHHDETPTFPQASWQLLNNTDTAAWTSNIQSGGYVALRFTPTSGPPVQLGDLAGPPTNQHSVPWAINAGGTVVGTSRDSLNQNRPVRWSAAGTTPTVLPTLTTTTGFPPNEGKANDINDDEYAVGWSGRFHPDFLLNLGNRAVRWDPAGNVMELGNISSQSVPCGENTCFLADAEAYAISNSEVAVGRATFYNNNSPDGNRAVRWDAAGNGTQLGHLGTENSPTSANTQSAAWAVNESGDAVGYARKYDGGGNFKGHRAVRWNHNSAIAQELEVLGTDSNGVSESKVFTLNDAGTAVGWSYKYVAGVGQGIRAVRWDAAGQATELEGLNGADGFGHAIDINSTGIAAGIFGNGPAPIATYWDTSGNSVDLNSLIDPNLGWELTHALAISDTGWIAGLGNYDPDGVSGQFKYARVFMLQLPAEPELPGDYNDDGTVDAGDYVLWRKHLGSMSTTLPNDTTPGSVLQEDFTVWRANFGNPSGGGSAAIGSANVVPEPQSVVLLVLASAFGVSRRIRRRSTDWNVDAIGGPIE
jgi:hypothetical protein